MKTHTHTTVAENITAEAGENRGNTLNQVACQVTDRSTQQHNIVAHTVLPIELCNTALSPKQLGKLGEQFAADWLTQRGHQILDRNWQTRYGEIDLVALSPEGTVLFVEVKTRRSVLHGIPQESVTAHKRLHLRRAGVQWLMDPEHRIPHTGVRFDVLAILAHNGKVRVQHIPEAF